MRHKVWHLGMAVILLAAMSGVGVADDWSRWHERNDRYAQKESREHQKLFDRGFNDGQKDRQHRRPFQIRNRRFGDGRDRQAYIAGYRAGYGPGIYRR